MANYKFLVYTNPVAGREEEFNQWYDTQHLGDILSIDAVKAAQRFRRATQPASAKADYEYLTVYDVDTEDPAEVLAEIGKRTKDRISEALDRGQPGLMWFTEVGERRTS